MKMLFIPNGKNQRNLPTVFLWLYLKRATISAEYSGIAPLLEATNAPN